MNLFIHNGTIVTMNRGRIIRKGALAIEGDTICAVGKTRELRARYGRGYERIDATGRVIIPGLINSHQHAAMSLFRGYADDLPLQQWLETRIWPMEKYMTPRDVYVGALLTATESIMSGTTTINTMYHYSPKENEAKALAEAGLRGVIGHACFSWRKKEDKRTIDELERTWHDKAEGRIRICIAPHSPYTVDPVYMQELKEIRDQMNVKHGKRAPVISHIHAAETADEAEKIHRAFKTKVKEGIMSYLSSLQALDKYTIAAHCIWLTSKDLTVMKHQKVKVSHNPVSNLKLASGTSPVPNMLKKGLTVSLGTDSPSSNNTADMFDTMKLAALIHKAVNCNPTLMPASKVLEMATLQGAKALSWDREIGSLESGKKADLAIVSFEKPHLQPVYNEVSHLVYAARASDVETVVVNGRIILENGKLATVKIEKVISAVQKAKNNLLNKQEKYGETGKQNPERIRGENDEF